MSNLRSMNVMKKIISLLAVIVLTATMLSSVAYAESVPTVNVSNKDGEVTFSVSSSFKGTGTVPDSGKTASFSFAKSDVTEAGGYSVNLDSDYSIEGVGADGTFSITGDGSNDIAVKFQHAGVYVFTLKETTAYQDAFVYDKSVYTLRFYVKNVDGGLEATVTAQKGMDESKSSAVEFQNSFAPVVVDPAFSKKVVNEDGTPASSSDTFTFEFKPDQNGYPLPDGSESGVKKVQIQGSGSTEIGQISFVKTGIYSYSLSEVQPTELVNRYKYDQSIYRYTFKVSRASQDEGNGSLKVSWTASDVNGNVVGSGEGLQAAGSDIITFTNTLIKTGIESESRKESESETKKIETEESETEKPKTPETNNNNSNNNGVKTGDQTPIALYVSLAAAALAVIIIGLVVIRKRKRS